MAYALILSEKRVKKYQLPWELEISDRSIYICIRRSWSAGSVYNTSTVKVIRRHLNPDRISKQDADVIPTHPSGEVCDNLMTIIKLNAKLRSGQSFNNGSVYSNLLFFFRHKTSLTWLLLVGLPERTSNSFLIIHPALLALGNEPAFTPYGAENTTLHDLLAKALEQGILRFIWSQSYTCHCYSPPFQVTTMRILRAIFYYTREGYKNTRFCISCQSNMIMSYSSKIEMS